MSHLHSRQGVPTVPAVERIIDTRTGTVHVKSQLIVEYKGGSDIMKENDKNLNEETSLLGRNSNNGPTQPGKFTKCIGIVLTLMTLVFTIATYPGRHNPSLFPPDFVWGVATSAYQIEGAAALDGRGPSIWDVFVQKPHAILDHSNGSIADDHYHLYKSDVKLLVELGVTSYRFSLSWSRILPNGTLPVNQKGLDFYHVLVDELLENNIQPWITLFHWDLPNSLQESYGGWLDDRTVDAFVDYAELVFDNFADRVQYFITINEPWTYAVNGHGSGVHAPGRNEHPDTEPYLAAHNLLLAHARVAKLFKSEYGNGFIGMANCGDFRYPMRPYDIEAAERAMLFQFGWFVDPLVFGSYPQVMRDRLGDRLPVFTEQQSRDLMESFDFLGLNYYSSLLALTPKRSAEYRGYWADIYVDFADDPKWKHNDMGWNVVPQGLKEMLIWISQRYNNPLIFVTENGEAVREHSAEAALSDISRQEFIRDHLESCASAILEGVRLGGYFYWSLLDNFEWQFGYLKRFGLYRVDYETQERTPKHSALWYRDIVGTNANSLKLNDSVGNKKRRLSSVRPLVPSPGRHRSIPDKVLIGYGGIPDKVREAVFDGVNIVIWAFVNVRASDSHGRAKLVTKLDLVKIRELIDELNELGYNVLHLVSVGGWNGEQLDSRVDAREWFGVFRDELGDRFDGIDWDLEGNDSLDSEYNYFSLDCLKQVGEISRLAKQDGFVISMAPPQSYLDISTERFSRYVNLTDPRQQWHSEFRYFGANVYAYLLQEYGKYIDLVSIQLYESYSEAARAIYHFGLEPSTYLRTFVTTLVGNDESFEVDFLSDPEIEASERVVSLPLRKLVFGLANGWAFGPNEKTLYIEPAELQTVWSTWVQEFTRPRGFMFWTINEEGKNGIFYARDLKRILNSTVTMELR